MTFAVLASTTTPEPTPAVTGPVAETIARCSNDASICAAVGRWTGSVRAGQAAELLIGTPLRIISIVLIGLLLRYVLHRIINRSAERIAQGQAGLGRLDDRLASATAILSANPLASARRAQRARTLASVLESVTTGVIGIVLVLMVLGELGYSLGPLIAGAGIAGVALGFGAQTLVKDFLSGIFMVVEDQYGVGDVVDLGEAVGSVEAVGLRVTRLRDGEGAVWYVRNGEVLRVGNKSQGWARAVVDLVVPYGVDLERVRAVLHATTRSLREDEEFAGRLFEDPEVVSIEAMQADGAAVRLIVKTEPLQQWDVGRELRSRLLAGLAAEGIDIALPYRAVAVPASGSGSGPAATG